MTPQVWHTLVVRVWRDRDGLKIRFLTVDSRQRARSLAVETSMMAAARRFASWLASIEPVPDPAPGAERSNTHDADAASTKSKTTDP